MGFEYQLRFRHDSPELVLAALRAVSVVRGSSGSTLEIAPSEQPGAWPAAFAAVEEFGLYFCSNTGVEPPLLLAIVSKLEEQFGPIQVESLDA